MGAAYTQTGVLAKGRAKGSAGEIEELGRELGLAGACPPPPRRGPAAGRGPPRKSPSRRPTGGEGLAQRARFGPRKWKGAPRVETTGGSWGGRPPGDDGTHTREAHRTDASQGLTKKRRERSGGEGEDEEASATRNSYCEL